MTALVDVIIPVYKPGTEFKELLQKLYTQTVKPNHIILMNTEEGYYDKFINETGFVPNCDIVEVFHLSKREFDHGRTRNMGVMKSDADVFICMTQDAIPADDCFIEKLIAPLEDKKIAASYGRQLAREDSSIAEKITRQFNYPEDSSVKSIEDTARLGIKTYFCSNVCCAYNRQIFDELGRFVSHTNFNEDMLYAAGAIKAGYKIAYAADARVYHSHNYTAGQQFHRNVDIGISQADHPEVFGAVSSESEGKKMVLTTISAMRDAGKTGAIIPYLYMTVCKYAGFLIGKNYKKLPRSFVRMCAMNKLYLE